MVWLLFGCGCGVGCLGLVVGDVGCGVAHVGCGGYCLSAVVVWVVWDDG